ncbi:ubiquinone/menaquinone biosynthesis C-methylase UbiE [Bradyrhizobium algeriense]|uniref:Ubiquinone/menaquinone biosynthesis C-methylase UbiE n=1 Tax=Bradyrhizobium algeriense TaxID=634784 RepID=A0ABU8BGF5_9BRAD
MSQSAELRDFYDGYYNEAVAAKRTIAAKQSVDHLVRLGGKSLGHLLDVGAGDGAVLQEIESRRIASKLDAVEISSSGIDRVTSRRLSTLNAIRSFDGYRLPFEDKSFDTTIAIHVLEHVEHERLFLNELKRVSKRVFIEVPLEHTFRLQRSIVMGKPFGHINHYTFDRFINLLDTCGLKPVASKIFPNSLAYETFVGGKAAGSAKHVIRSTALKFAPALAPNVFVYLGAAMCDVAR